MRAPLKTLGIWRKSSVGIDARIILNIYINSYLRYKRCMTKNGEDLGSFLLILYIVSDSDTIYQILILYIRF